jgi:hypothetical protein
MVGSTADCQSESAHLMNMKWLSVVMMVAPLAAAAQQRSDDAFHFDNPTPAFPQGDGPRVCVDETHHNFHTAHGRYKPFAELLRGDGYRVTRYTSSFTGEALTDCDLLVVANPLAEANAEDWSYPHPSAFTQDEIRELMQWVRAGGRFLLFADHAPIAGAARDLAVVFGVVMLDVYADGTPGGADVFRIADGTIQPHAIVEGRGAHERVDSVTTFTGQAFQITQSWQPLLVFGPEAVAGISLTQAFQRGSSADWPRFSVEGWVHGAARE